MDYQGEGCIKCGCNNFEHDRYFDEYICIDCGFTTSEKPNGNVHIEESSEKPNENVTLEESSENANQWESYEPADIANDGIDFLDDVYPVGGYIIGAITFIACWIYAYISWGFLLGVGLGWIPSLFIAGIVGFIWPLLVLLLFVGIVIAAWLVGGIGIIGFLKEML